jgi:hypothetical protein
VFRGLKKAVAVAAVAASIAGSSVLPSTARAETAGLFDPFSGYSTGTEWKDSSTHGFWKAVFDGYGRIAVTKDDSKVLSLRPKASDEASETHAALVVSKRTFEDVDMTLRMKTVDQLRVGKPNPWEVAWSLWHYQDNTHFYYLILKPNGWELGKADPAYPGAQRFLATGSKSFAVGRWHDVRVRQVGSTMTVWANGDKLTTFKDAQRPYRSGHVGVYNEDAKTFFDDVEVDAV